MFNAYSRYFFSILFSLLIFSHLTYAAETFEGAGTVNQVLAGESIVVVNGSEFFLSRTVYNSGSSDKKPVINLLREGTVIGFSGTTSTPHNRITSVSIHSQPAE